MLLDDLYVFATKLTPDEIRLLLDLMKTPAGQVHRIVHAVRPDMAYVTAVGEHFAEAEHFAKWMLELTNAEAVRIRDTRLLPILRQ